MASTAPSPKKKPSTILRITLFWAVVVFGALIVYALTGNHENLKQVPISDVITQANKGEVTKIVVEGSQLTITPKGSDKATQTSVKDSSSSLQEQGLNADAPVTVEYKTPSATGDILWNLAIIIVPVVLIAVFFLFMMRQAQGQNNQAMGFGKSKAILYGDDKKKVVFSDIAGNDAAKQDLEEVVEKNGGHASFPVDLLLVADGRVESPDGVAFQAAH